MKKKMPTIREDVAVLKEQVKEIKDNHLAHMDAKIDTLFSRFDRQQWFLITTLAGVAISLGLLLLK